MSTFFININGFFVGQTNIKFQLPVKSFTTLPHNGLQGFPGIVSFVPINKAPLG
jgi:hypothetical protein